LSVSQTPLPVRLDGMTNRAYAIIETMDAPADLFNTHRPRLFGIAYRMLGSRADAQSFVIDGTRIRAIYAVRNPDKLSDI